MNKELIKKCIPQNLWKYLRTRQIVHNHKHVAAICRKLISDYYPSVDAITHTPLKEFDDDKIIWQYWAQGYDDVPEIVKQCLDSVDKYAEGCKIIRLSDSNLSDYLNLPGFVTSKRGYYSAAHFSDLLRLLLLSTYGGVWLDATVLLTDRIPEKYHENDFFMYQRDYNEEHKDYWENTYAYYFGWNKKFRVNVLNSIIFAKKGSVVIDTLSGLMLKWWKENDSLPDYFFFQILFDVLINGKLEGHNCPIVSDCQPHYLQQSINDPDFDLMSKEEIMATFPIHKLTYKKQ